MDKLERARLEDRESDRGKKTYERPEVTVYGDLELFATGTTMGSMDVFGGTQP